MHTIITSQLLSDLLSRFRVYLQVCFDYATTVERIFSHPHNPLLSMDETTLKADPDEPYSFDDPDVVRRVCRVVAVVRVAQVHEFREGSISMSCWVVLHRISKSSPLTQTRR